MDTAASVRAFPSAPFLGFLVLALAIGAVRVVLSPASLMPSEFWVIRPLHVAEGVATVLLGSALFARRPDVWSRSRPLVAAVTLLALGTFLQSGAVLLILVSWMGAASSTTPASLPFVTNGSILVGALVGTLARWLLWIGARRSRRLPGRTGRPWPAIALWISTLGLIVGHVSSAIRVSDVGIDPARAVTVISLVTGIASLVAMTAFTATALAGARAGESQTIAWRLAAASGVVFVLSGWLTPIVGIFASELAVDAIVIREAMRLGSTLLLLVAFALGFGSARKRALARPVSSPSD
jgi:hypothetical protein